MRRGHLQLVFLAGVLCLIMVPATILSSAPLLGGGPERAAHQGHSDASYVPEPAEPDKDARDDTRNASQPEGNDAQPGSSRPDRAIGSRQGATPRDDQIAGGPQIEPEAESSEEADEPAGNRSVVGWSSGSISQLQSESKPVPVRLLIPSLSIDADVDGVGVDGDGAMVIPDAADTVGWYKSGPAPGEPGSSVIAGHLDDANGRSVFFDLSKIADGAEVVIELDDGREAAFRVIGRQAYDATSLPGDTLFARDGDPVLALVTCTGVFDRSAGRYTETLVVYASPTS